MDKLKFVDTEIKKKLLTVGYPAHIRDEITYEYVFKFFQKHDLVYRIESIDEDDPRYSILSPRYYYAIDVGPDCTTYEDIDESSYCVKSSDIYEAYDQAERACIERLLQIFEIRMLGFHLTYLMPV